MVLPYLLYYYTAAASLLIAASWSWRSPSLPAINTHMMRRSVSSDIVSLITRPPISRHLSPKSIPSMPSFSMPHRALSHAASCGLSAKRNTPRNRIIDGEETVTGQYPWIVSLQAPTHISGEWEPYCAGSLIAPNALLTAAHCSPSNRAEKYKHLGRARFRIVRLVAGCRTWDRAENDSRCQIIILPDDSFVDHPAYATDYIIDASIAILPQPFEMTDYVRTICLPPEQEYYQGMATTAGFGSHSGSTAPRDHSAMMYVHLNILPPSVCANFNEDTDAYNFTSEPLPPYTFDIEKEICVGFSSNTRGFCHGDSGGPLMVKIGPQNFVIGIVRAVEEGCIVPGYPGLAVRVTSLRRWIDHVLHNQPNNNGK